MAGYSRTDTTNNIADGNIINASDFDGEFDAIATAFTTSGHTHDGTGENGGAITKIGPTQDLVVSGTLVTPKTDNTLAIGTSSLQFTDLHLTGSISATGLATDITVAGTKKIQFQDTGTFINSSADGQLDIDADGTVQINTATLDIDASSSVNISGATTIGGVITATTGTHSLGATSFNENNITNVGDIQLDSITGEGDTDTSITFSGGDIITIATGGSNRLTIANGALSPVTTNQIDLGTSSLEYKNAFFDGTVTTDALVAGTADIDAGTIDGVTLGTNSAITQAVIDNVNINGAQIGHTDDTDLVTLADQAVTIAGSLTLTGGLTVNGTTTTVATTNTVVSDSLIELANGTSGSPSNDAGIVIERGSANNAFIGFDESADKFIVGTGTFTGASTGNLTITTGTLVANVEGLHTGTIRRSSSHPTFTLPSADGTNGQFLKTDGSGELAFASALSSITLGTDTSGNYASAVTAGTGVSVSGSAGEGTSFAVSIGQAVATSSDVQFDSFGVGTGASGTTGEIRATNNITAFYSSDKRLKENIVNIPNALDKVMNINGVEFDWSTEYMEAHGGQDDLFNRKHQVGVIAQEVEKVLPEVVADRPDGYKAVRYEQLTALLIEAVKDLKQELDNHKQGCKCHDATK